MGGTIFMKRLLIASLILLLAFGITLYIKDQTIAADAPHTTTQSVFCNSCHSVHRAWGTGLTKSATNANLCLSCHAISGIASTKRLDATMLATPGISGTSHRWDTAMPTAPTTPTSQYGLKAASELPTGALKSRLGAYNNVITCSVCHNQHGQASTPWDPYAPASGNGRHFQRTSNELNQMCEECHAYRKAATSGTDVRTYDETKKSHPVVKNLTSDVNANQFVGAAPLESALWNYSPQTTAPRYHEGGGGDTNKTNNIVLDSSSKVRCLSCHGIHYTDSSSGTVDGP
ncbi:MAG: hypothetical protein FD156_1812 [Nitrospirae bacterium]|nr:MAG: hypothetical protein FD156_1812 [Nitrospirota bacterium]